MRRKSVFYAMRLARGSSGKEITQTDCLAVVYDFEEINNIVFDRAKHSHRVAISGMAKYKSVTRRLNWVFR